MINPIATSSVSLVRIDSRDARRMTDALGLLRDRLSKHDGYYPNIDRWVAEKVVPDLRTGRRIGYVGLDGETPVLAAVLKRGPNSKFCHLSIESGFQGNKLGHLMFSLMAAEVRHAAREIHFTLPEGLWEKEKGFFQTFGFETAVPASSQYRLFEQELRCSASFTDVWRKVVAQLPTLLTSSSIAGFDVNDGVVISISERHAKAVMQGHKTVELRHRFADRWAGRNASVYATGHAGALLGTVTIDDVIKGRPEEIWERFSAGINCTREEFDNYVENRTVLCALQLSNPRPYEAPVPLSQLSHLVGERLRPPQSHSAHSASDLWGRALSLAAILHASCEGPTGSFDHPSSV